MPLDLDRYLERIGWARADLRPTFETLAGLLIAHMSSIPFENLDVLLHRPVKLDLDSIQAKLVDARRGGYCFEHTTLFAAVLEAVGFEPVRHSARVVLFQPKTASPRAHMFLTVTLDGERYVVDPGFGGLAARTPLPLFDAGEEENGAPTHWLARDGADWVLRTRTAGQPTDAWVSTMEQDFPVDYEMANHFIATHPESPFVNLLMMSIFTADGRVSLINRDFTIRSGEETISGQLVDRSALKPFLARHFGIDLAEADHLKVPAIPEWA